MGRPFIRTLMLCLALLLMGVGGPAQSDAQRPGIVYDFPDASIQDQEAILGRITDGFGWRPTYVTGMGTQQVIEAEKVEHDDGTVELNITFQDDEAPFGRGETLELRFKAEQDNTTSEAHSYDEGQMRQIEDFTGYKVGPPDLLPGVEFWGNPLVAVLAPPVDEAANMSPEAIADRLVQKLGVPAGNETDWTKKGPDETDPWIGPSGIGVFGFPGLPEKIGAGFRVECEGCTVFTRHTEDFPSNLNRALVVFHDDEPVILLLSAWIDFEGSDLITTEDGEAIVDRLLREEGRENSTIAYQRIGHGTAGDPEALTFTYLTSWNHDDAGHEYIVLDAHTGEIVERYTITDGLALPEGEEDPKDRDGEKPRGTEEEFAPHPPFVAILTALGAISLVILWRGRIHP